MDRKGHKLHKTFSHAILKARGKVTVITESWVQTQLFEYIDKKVLPLWSQKLDLQPKENCVQTKQTNKQKIPLLGLKLLGTIKDTLFLHCPLWETVLSITVVPCPFYHCI